MLYYLLKLSITSVLVVAISEVSKTSSFIGAVLASIPLVSVLAMTWLYIETGDSEKVASLATGVFWLVIPSLVLFVSLPVLLRAGVNFYLGLGLSIALTISAYFLTIFVLQRFGIEL